MRISYLVIGLLIGAFFHASIITRLYFAPAVDQGLFYTISCYSALLFVFSSRYRCISLACLPTFFARNGRRIIMTLLVTDVITGPLDNMASNAESAVSSITCQSKLLVLQEFNHMQLKMKPFIMLVQEIAKNQKEMKHEGNDLAINLSGYKKDWVSRKISEKKKERAERAQNETNLLKKHEILDEPIHLDVIELDKANEPFFDAHIEQTGAFDNDTDVANVTCESITQKDKKDCKEEKEGPKGTTKRHFLKKCQEEKFRSEMEKEDHNFCRSQEKSDYKTFLTRIPWKNIMTKYNPTSAAIFGLYQMIYGGLPPTDHWEDCPMYFFNMSAPSRDWYKIEIDICTENDKSENVTNVDKNVYKEYMAAQKGLKDTYDTKSSFKMNISTPAPKFGIDEEVKDQLKHLYRQRKLVAEGIREVWSTFIALLLMMSVWNSIQYHNNYLKDINFDNVYLTDYFIHVDRRRRRYGKVTLLPIKELDSRTELLFPWSRNLSMNEKSKVIRSFVLWLIFLCILGIILYFDHLLSIIIESFYRNLALTKFQHGVHDIKYKVYGTGSVSNSIRKLFGGDLHVRVDLDELTSLDMCRPQYSFLSGQVYLTFSLWMFLWFMLNVTDVLMLRSRRAICAAFYPIREKQRVLYLYNSLLRSRKKYLNYQIRKKLLEKRKLLEKKGSDGPKTDESSVGIIVDVMSDHLCRLCVESPVNGIRCAICETSYCSQCWDMLTRLCLKCSTMREFEERFRERQLESLLEDNEKPKK